MTIWSSFTRTLVHFFVCKEDSIVLKLKWVVFICNIICISTELCTCILKDEELAIKLIDIQNSNARHWEMVEREIEVLQRAEEKKHPNIVSFNGHFKHNGVPCLVMEYCGGGTLYQKIRDLKTEGKFIKEEDFMSYLTQIASAVEVYYQYRMTHSKIIRISCFIRSNEIALCSELVGAEQRSRLTKRVSRSGSKISFWLDWLKKYLQF